MITRLALEALPPSGLKSFFDMNRARLMDLSVMPDTVLKQRYGQAEARRHYIDLEYFGAHPFSALQPSRAAMDRRFGRYVLRRSGTLPWTVEEFSGRLETAWRQNECRRVLELAGYLAHYVGDASQPLHTTIHYDGYPEDKGIHARLEASTDRAIASIADLARAQVRVRKIDAVWPQVIRELRESRSDISEVLAADRLARSQSPASGRSYDRRLMEREGRLIAGRIADAASVLGSIWLFEWQQAGAPQSCPVAAAMNY